MQRFPPMIFSIFRSHKVPLLATCFSKPAYPKYLKDNLRLNSRNLVSISNCSIVHSANHQNNHFEAFETPYFKYFRNKSNNSIPRWWQLVPRPGGILLVLFLLLVDWEGVHAAKPIAEENAAAMKKKKSKRERYNFISEVVESVAETVVSIEVKDHSHVDFFTGAPQTASNGSGFIVQEDGLILTNAHVVAARPRSSFSVRLSDGRSFAAVIEDIDYESDLATIRINAKKLPTLSLGISADTKIGEWVVALGAPLALTNTITAGVVSSVSRGASELGIRTNAINYIQTDAAITFGNSGGPLINLDGEAIGINSMKVAAGISFAIPIDHAKTFLAKAEARRCSGKRKPARRYMGITILTLTDQIKRELDLRAGYSTAKSGVLVWQVVVGSPAYLAGIQPGDIIVQINNTEIHSSSDLYDVVKTADKLNIRIQRGEKLYSCIITPEIVIEE